MPQYKQGNCPEPAKFAPGQLVRIVGHVNRQQLGLVFRHFTTEECGHEAPYEHVYEIALVTPSGPYQMSYKESELEAVEVHAVGALDRVLEDVLRLQRRLSEAFNKLQRVRNALDSDV